MVVVSLGSFLKILNLYPSYLFNPSSVPIQINPLLSCIMHSGVISDKPSSVLIWVKCSCWVWAVEKNGAAINKMTNTHFNPFGTIVLINLAGFTFTVNKSLIIRIIHSSIFIRRALCLGYTI